MFLKFCKIHRNTPEACNFIKKETLTQMFSFEFYEISKNFNNKDTKTTSEDFCENSYKLKTVNCFRKFLQISFYMSLPPTWNSPFWLITDEMILKTFWDLQSPTNYKPASQNFKSYQVISILSHLYQVFITIISSEIFISFLLMAAKIIQEKTTLKMNFIGNNR